MDFAIIKSCERTLKSALGISDCDNTVADIVKSAAEFKVRVLKSDIFSKSEILAETVIISNRFKVVRIGNQIRIICRTLALERSAYIGLNRKMYGNADLAVRIEHIICYYRNISHMLGFQNELILCRGHNAYSVRSLGNPTRSRVKGVSLDRGKIGKGDLRFIRCCESIDRRTNCRAVRLIHIGYLCRIYCRFLSERRSVTEIR